MGFIRRTFGGGAERDAARIQAEASDAAQQTQREGLETARGDLATFRGLGEGVADSLLQFVLDGPETEFERTRGFDQIERSAAARGKLSSGGTLEELTEFNSGLNERNRGNRFRELFNLATLGANAASGQATATLGTSNNISSLQTGKGDALAAGEIGAANATRGSIFDIARIGASALTGGAGG